MNALMIQTYLALKDCKSIVDLLNLNYDLLVNSLFFFLFCFFFLFFYTPCKKNSIICDNIYDSI